MKNKILNGDVLLLRDGSLAMALYFDKKKYAIQYIDRNDPSFIPTDALRAELNLGQTDSVIVSFLSARSLHLRLNKLNGINLL